MAKMVPLNPVVAVDVAQTRYRLEALEAGRPSAGLQATVRVTEGATIHKSDTLILADEGERKAFASSTLIRIDPTTGGAPSAGEVEAALLDLQTAVETALRGPTGGAGIAGAPAGQQAQQGPYVVEDFCTYWVKPVQGGTVRTLLANFAATITGERVIDDGANEPRTDFEVAGELAGGGRLRTLTVSADRFGTMHWVAAGWGTRAIVQAGAAVKDHLRVAIQSMSAPTRRVTFAHCGWRRLDGGQWVYLHANGAIGKDGALPDGSVDVALGGNLRRLSLPDPPHPDSPELVEAVQMSLDLLRVAPDEVMVPLLGATYRAPLAELEPPDLSVMATGKTGRFKTELTTLCQQHFGATFGRKALPAQWSATANYVEKVIFEAKDAVVVVDDFAPGGSSLNVMKMHETAARVFRGIGNHGSRGRMAADGSLRPDYPPRGLLISSGEDVPAGSSSVTARLFLVEVGEGAVSTEALTVAQDRARTGAYARAMAAYLQWLALRLDDERDVFSQVFTSLRERASASDLHKRTPESVANLGLGWARFLTFAVQRGALTEEERVSLWERVWAALGTVARAQQAHVEEQNPVRRFLEGLDSAISGGHAHVAGPDGEEPTDDPRLWGWVRHVRGAGQSREEEWQRRGECVGWLVGDDLYLHPMNSYTAAEAQAKRSSGTLGVQPVTLRKRLDEDGLLASVEIEKQAGRVVRHLTPRACPGRRDRVLHLHVATLRGEKGSPPPSVGKVGFVGQVGQNGTDGAVPQEGDEQGAPQSGPTSGAQGGKVGQESGADEMVAQGQPGSAAPQSPLTPQILSTYGHNLTNGAAVGADPAVELEGTCRYGHQAADTDAWGQRHCADPECPDALEGLWPTDLVAAPPAEGR